ncbi:G-box-binding factor isoform X2 [Ceratitis capitata]|uniref:G-box-binding factor isoform X2 n=1 Tax=Ceratitis capitata TaxID=7213 RepID=UPI00061895B2|nr:G-box-binding factor isoform X2 [Ceratitis capitata]
MDHQYQTQTETANTTISQGNNTFPTAATVDYVNYDYPQPSKRGRGYAPTGEFDLSLIREFRARPGFYDRNSPIFKDKLQTAHQWQEISNNLGYDVSLLKDRMLQLRNRYNLEKRRLEQLRDENPGQHIDSPWPLFKHLHFLSEHIRPRRSYKSMQPRTSLADTGDEDEQQQQQQPLLQHEQHLEPLQQQQQSELQFDPQQMQQQQNMSIAGGDRHDSLSDGGGTGNGDLSAFANGILTVKMEEPDGDDANIADAESGSQSGEDTRRGHPLKLSAASTLLSMQQRQPHSKLPFAKTTHPSSSSSLSLNKRTSKYIATPAAMPPSIKIRRLDTMQERAGVLHLQPRPNIPQNNNFNNSNHNIENMNSKSNALRQKEAATVLAPRPAYNLQVNRRCLTNSEQKYAAFGDFVSSSLLELPATCALQLVEKFTSEVVRVLLNSKEKNAQDASGDGGVAQPSAIQPITPLPSTQQLQQINGVGVGETVNGV